MSDRTDRTERSRRRWRERSDSDTELAERRARAAAAPAARSLTEVLSEDRLALIVEPATERDALGPVVAESEQSGASAISVKAEAHVDGATIDAVIAARAGCNLPIIARDIVVDVRQVYEHRAAGADAIRIPAYAHVDDDDHELDIIVLAAHQLGMEIVLAVQSDDELAFALDTDVDVINIDNRDDSGRVDVERTFELLADVPVGWPVISESIDDVSRVAKLHRAGVDALLLDEGHLDTGLTNALATYADLTLDA